MRDCIICRHKYPVSDYSLGGLQLNKDLFKICPPHLVEVDARIAELSAKPEKVILKTGDPKSFVPPMQKDPFHNYQDGREPGMDDA